MCPSQKRRRIASHIQQPSLCKFVEPAGQHQFPIFKLLFNLVGQCPEQVDHGLVGREGVGEKAGDAALPGRTGQLVQKQLAQSFALVFGDYEVNITTPADHVLDGTGRILNRKEMLTKKQWKRYQEALTSYDKPVVIVTQEEAEENEKEVSSKTKTWRLRAENVRDFAFATSRKYILDGQAVKIGDSTVMAISLYPKEGNPLWEEYSTRVVASTLKSYSSQMFDYPYHKAISVHADRIGMEYPMITFNGPRTDLQDDGERTYSLAEKRFLVGVVIHEIGHIYFPMTVNSDERQWTWMDEGINTFLQGMAELEWQERYPSRRGPPPGGIARPGRLQPGLRGPRLRLAGLPERLRRPGYPKGVFGGRAGARGHRPRPVHERPVEL